jgi:hypothetical protein
VTGWGVRTHLWPVAAGRRSWGQPDLGDAREGGSSPDDAGTGQHRQMARVRLARRRGVRVQKPVVEPPKEQCTGSNLVDLGRDCSAPKPSTTGGDGLGVVDAGSRDEVLRGSRGHACRGKAGRRSRQTVCGERGNRSWSAFPPGVQLGGGKACGLLMGQERDGGSVVVRGRESRPHGEGAQRARKEGTGMPGGRW